MRRRTRDPPAAILNYLALHDLVYDFTKSVSLSVPARVVKAVDRQSNCATAIEDRNIGIVEE